MASSIDLVRTHRWRECARERARKDERGGESEKEEGECMARTRAREHDRDYLLFYHPPYFELFNPHPQLV